MKTKEWLFAVIGGVVGAVLTMAAGSLAPLGAQNEVREAEFGTITCRKIKVVDAEGKICAVMSEGFVVVADKESEAGVSMGDGYVRVKGKDGHGVFIGGRERGGQILVEGNDGNPRVRISGIYDDENISVFAKGALTPGVHIGANERGGKIEVGCDGRRQFVGISAENSGGKVYVGGGIVEVEGEYVSPGVSIFGDEESGMVYVENNGKAQVGIHAGHLGNAFVSVKGGNGKAGVSLFASGVGGLNSGAVYVTDEQDEAVNINRRD